MSDSVARHILFERCFNFRDLGGYKGSDGRRVRWRRLFRSMTPQFMTEADVQLARDLGVRKVIDLRYPPEPGIDSGSLGEPPSRRLVVPFASSRGVTELRDMTFDRVLLRMLELDGPPIVEALEFITGDEDGLPPATRAGATLFHCQTGKDRTGILAATLLKLLGVSDTDVIQDYLHSVGGFEAMTAYADQSGEAFRLHAPDAPAIAMAPPEESWIRGVLAGLEERGGAKAYLRANGASEELLQRFRELMLEAE
jgi:protein-tyrosine phosphatase